MTLVPTALLTMLLVTHCQVGKYFDGSSCQNCPSGKIKSKEYEISCTECVASVPNSERVECLPCAAGKAFQSDNGCVDCRPGTFGELFEQGESLYFVETVHRVILCQFCCSRLSEM